MQLASLLEGTGARLNGPDARIDDVCYDSRQVSPGALFIALRGETTDGHRYAAQAVSSGAAALLVEERPADVADDFPVATVADTRALLFEVSTRFFAHPTRDLTLIGVTGTNGKTSTVRMLESILNGAGRRAGSMGTISIRHPGFEETARLTTPESLDMQRSLARMRDARVEFVAMEVSSHSLALGRVAGLKFAVGVYTHLSQDHLDFHETMERYAEAKSLLFGSEHLDGTAVLNASDPHAARFGEIARAAGNRVIRFARDAKVDAEIRSIEQRVELDGAWLRVETPEGEQELTLPLPGDFQVENALAAAGAARALGVSWSDIQSGLASCPAVPGRLERVGEGAPIVLVDYAHTPDALVSVLSRIRPLLTGKLITVFGCGGDRDRTKRAPMARAACAHSDYAVATSDNPRTEDPDAILSDVSEGLSGDHVVIRDRREAIAHAIGRAAERDVVVIAGKGHEDYQILGTKKFDFDDRVEAQRALDAIRGVN